MLNGYHRRRGIGMLGLAGGLGQDDSGFTSEDLADLENIPVAPPSDTSSSQTEWYVSPGSYVPAAGTSSIAPQVGALASSVTGLINAFTGQPIQSPLAPGSQVPMAPGMGSSSGIIWIGLIVAAVLLLGRKKGK